MFGFFKKKITATEYGFIEFSYLKKKYLEGHPEGKGIYPSESEIGPDMVKLEWLYFRAFTVDFTVYLALGNSKEKDAILNSFLHGMKDWLQTVPVPALPERFLMVGGPRTIPPENSETSFARLQRRWELYADAVKTPHHMGENWMVAGTFAGLCGNMDASVIAGVGAFFSSQKIENVKIMRSYKIIA